MLFLDLLAILLFNLSIGSSSLLFFLLPVAKERGIETALSIGIPVVIIACILLMMSLFIRKTKDRFSSDLHKWGDWEYEEEARCTQAKKCLRCGVKEKREDIHVWGWKYEREGSCHTVKYCSRCGREKQGIERHEEWRVLPKEEEWLAWKRCHFTKQCLRCGRSEEYEDHVWGPTEQRQWGNYEYVYSASICERCGTEG